ncbi:MAG: hypothetical protein ABJN69_01615 [Hellea sp.]
MKTLKRIFAFIFKLFILFLKILSVSALTALIASLFSTQRVIGSLSEIGGAVQFDDRLSMTVYDAFYFGRIYWGFITLAFIAAFIAAWALHKGVKFGRPIIFAGAGAVAILVMLLAMEQVFFGVPIVAGARDGVGLLLQMLAGGIGGFLFTKLTTLKTQADTRAQ